MYEYKIQHKYNGCVTFIWGGSFESACKKANINPKIWECIFFECIED